MSIRNCDGLLVILALVRQQGLYPPVEAVPPKPSNLLLALTITRPEDSPLDKFADIPQDSPYLSSGLALSTSIYF